MIMDNNFLQMLLQGGGFPEGMFQKPGAGIKANEDGMITVDPLTGLPIKEKKQRSLKGFLRNPRGITPGNALNFDVPQWNPTGSSGGGLGASLARILGGAK